MAFARGSRCGVGDALRHVPASDQGSRGLRLSAVCSGNDCFLASASAARNHAGKNLRGLRRVGYLCECRFFRCC